MTDERKKQIRLEMFHRTDNDERARLVREALTKSDATELEMRLAYALSDMLDELQAVVLGDEL